MKIRDIAEDQPRPLTLAFSPAFIKEALEGLNGLSYDLEQSRASIDARISRSGENVFIQGRMLGQVVVPCSRCLKEARLDVDVPLRIVVGPEDLGGEESLDEEIEYFTHDGDALSLGDMMRESLILTLPMAPLCRPDCRGLCAVCGNDLNERECGCDRRVVDPRLAALKDVKILKT